MSQRFQLSRVLPIIENSNNENVLIVVSVEKCVVLRDLTFTQVLFAH